MLMSTLIKSIINPPEKVPSGFAAEFSAMVKAARAAYTPQELQSMADQASAAPPETPERRAERVAILQARADKGDEIAANCLVMMRQAQPAKPAPVILLADELASIGGL